MKKLALFVVSLLISAGIAFAADTSSAIYTSPNGKADGFADLLNSQDYITHNHAYVDNDSWGGADKQKHQSFTAGIGADVEVVRLSSVDDSNIFNSIELQGRIFKDEAAKRNLGTSVMLVTKISLPEVASFLDFSK